MKFNTRPTNLILLKTLFFFGLGIKRVFAIIIKNISRHNINYAIDLFFFYKTFWIHRLFFNTCIFKSKSFTYAFSKTSRNNRTFDFCIWTTNFYFITRRACREIHRDFAKLMSRVCAYSFFEFLPSRLVLEKQAKLNFEAEIPFVWRADEWAGGNFERIPNSQLTASGFVFPDPVSCEIAQPIRAPRLRENLVVEKTLSFRLIHCCRLSFHSESQLIRLRFYYRQHYFCRWKFIEISGK